MLLVVILGYEVHKLFIRDCEVNSIKALCSLDLLL